MLKLMLHATGTDTVVNRLAEQIAAILEQYEEDADCKLVVERV